MSIQEKKAYLTLIGNVLIFGLYCVYVYFKYQDQIVNDPNDFAFWGKRFLIMIPLSIVGHIILHIIFSIANRIATNEDIPTFTDELDKLIELRSERSSHWTFVFGFIAAMVTQVMGMEPFVMLLTLFGAGLGASVIGDLTKIYHYRQGI